MKNQSMVLIIGLGIIVVGAIAYSVGTHTAVDTGVGMGDDDIPHDMHRMPDGSLMGNAGHGDHAMMMVASERAFLEGMIPHHQEAVDTAKEVLARGGSTPEMRMLAEDIIAAQEKEIAMMKAWYQAWYGEVYVPNPAAYMPMMRDLSALQGAALDRVFLEDMIMHHRGAIMMAESVQPYIEHQEITDLTNAIVETQTVEIELMENLRRGL